jgi:chemotaxis protein methyltransferase CheR
VRKTILPELMEMRSGTRKLTCWSAAASTGQEAYSLAMMLLEMGVAAGTSIFSAPISRSRVLKQAESGRYSQLEVNRGLPVALLLKYFRRAGLEWELKEEVRRMVRFRSFDLRSGMQSLGPFDVVFCRNVLIYFDLPTKKRILEEIHGSLFRGGYLLVGTTEAGLPAGDRFRRTCRRQRRGLRRHLKELYVGCRYQSATAKIWKPSSGRCSSP